ncbi:hypothetical protein PJI16_02060 [Nitrospira sp. MA-1]|nr:hypothetical protein [Nitrospira sp. MA-1]
MIEACRLAPRRDALLSWRTLFERSELVRFPSLIPWPGGMAEQCNRHREKGGQCLSPSALAQDKLRELASPPWVCLSTL